MRVCQLASSETLWERVMLPSVFLSLSGEDAEFVRRVHGSLPGGQANFYEKSFENGEKLLRAMEERVAASDIFVLFASKKSLQSTWVNFEIDRARVHRIRNEGVGILVFPIEEGIPFESIPDWMKEFWIEAAGWKPKDIARFIRRKIVERTRLNLGYVPPQGRGQLLDKIRRKIAATTLEIGESPKIFVIAGLDGIGRRTILEQVFLSAYPASPSLPIGPVIQLPQLADLEDIFRAVRLEISDSISPEELGDEMRAFATLEPRGKIQELMRLIQHFDDLGQSLTFVSGNILFEDKGILKHWVQELFFELLRFKRLVTIFVTNRSIHENEFRNLNLSLQETVDPLDGEDIKTIIASALREQGHQAVLPSDAIIRAIGGHPAVARAVSKVLGSKGVAIVNNAPKLVFDEQETILSAALDGRVINEREKALLSILSWVPRINGNTLIQVISTYCSITNESVAVSLNDLLVSCLVQNFGEDYAISAPIRGMFRRRHGFGDAPLLKLFADAVKEEWKATANSGQMRADLFDAMVYIMALEGSSVPDEFRDLLLPSTLQDVIKDTYDRRHLDDSALERVAVWGAAAMQMHMNDTVREEISSYYLRALVRLGRADEAKQLLASIEKKSYRSFHYLKSFYHRIVGNDMSAALSELSKARKVKKYRNQVISDTALCLKGLGKWDQLRELLNEESDSIGRNVALTDIAIGMLVADAKFPEAEELIKVMQNGSFDDGRSESRLATIVMKRDKDFDRAYDILTDLLNRRTRGAMSVRALRGVAAARGGQFGRAEDDAAYFQHRPNGSDTFHRIKAETLLKKREYSEALEEVGAISMETAQDRLLKARILEAQALDAQTSIQRKDQLLNEAEGIRSANRSADEFHIDW